MIKLLVCLFSMIAIFFGSSQSVIFECQYTGSQCFVLNSVSITSFEAAQIDSISGTHLPGHNNDNVLNINIHRGQIHYFPRNLERFFKNLEQIHFHNVGMKELHKSDLMPFPKLICLLINSCNLEILEENLFEFNPNLQVISIGHNKISHIDPNVFDKLTKLHTLHLGTNPCINMNTLNLIRLEDVIKAAKTQCINSNYFILVQKFKSLEIDSKNLGSDSLKTKLENLENETKNLNLSNTFHAKLQNLKEIQAEKEKEEKVSKLIEETNKKVSVISSEMANLTKMCAVDNVNELKTNNEKISKAVDENSGKLNLLEHKLTDLGSMHLEINKLDQKIVELDEKVFKHSKDTATTLFDIESLNSQNFATILNFIENLSKKMMAIEDKLAGIDDIQKKLNEIESRMDENKAENN